MLADNSLDCQSRGLPIEPTWIARCSLRRVRQRNWPRENVNGDCGRTAFFDLLNFACLIVECVFAREPYGRLVHNLKEKRERMLTSTVSFEHPTFSPSRISTSPFVGSDENNSIIKGPSDRSFRSTSISTGVSLGVLLRAAVSTLGYIEGRLCCYSRYIIYCL